MLGSLLSLALPFASHAADPGHFIKGSGDTIYWLGSDNKRYVFPDEVSLQSWLSDSETQGEVLDDADLAAHPIGGAMTVRPGSYLIRFDSYPTLYVVSHGAVLHAVSEDLAAAFYGKDWNLKLQTVDVTLYANYQLGQPLKYTSDFDAQREQAAAATPDDEIVNKQAVGSFAKSPTPFTGTVTFTEDPGSTSSTPTYIATVTKTNAPINNLRIDLYNESGVYQISCLGSDRCRLVLDTSSVKTDTKLRYYAVVSNERGETLDKAYSPYVIITPASSLPPTM